MLGQSQTNHNKPPTPQIATNKLKNCLKNFGGGWLLVICCWWLIPF